VIRNQLNTSIEVYQLPLNRIQPFLDSAAESETQLAAKYLQQSFDALLASDERLASWVRAMQKLELQAVVFGGWARDRLIEMICSRDCISRDIDFVAHGDVSVVEFLPQDAVINPFGGFGVQATQIHVDVWNLRDTFLIRRNSLPASFEQLALTADYTTNALVFQPAQFFQHSKVIDRGAVSAIRNGVLEFAAEEVAQPRVQAARALILSVRLQLKLSQTVHSFVKIICSPKEAREAVTNGIQLYCPPPLLQEVILLLDSIVSEGNRINEKRI
jgi:hypothetical protein